jgi:hypothetical protein
MLDIEWTPPERTPRRLPQEQINPSDLLSNPIIVAGLLSSATGQNVQPPVSGQAGREYMAVLIREGRIPPSFDF